MPQTTSLGQAQSSRKTGGLVAGLGAALIASAITAVMMTSNPAPSAAPAEAVGPKQCQVMQRQFLVSTTGGGGTVRLREGSYLSPPIVLGANPQTVTFPIPRPQDAPSAAEVITIEGNATNVVLTSPVTSWRHVFGSVNGVTAFESRWWPVKTC
jgi:hypothetical protein